MKKKKVSRLGCGVSGVGVWSLGCGGWGFDLHVSCFLFRDPSLTSRASYLVFRVSGLRFRSEDSRVSVRT